MSHTAHPDGPVRHHRAARERTRPRKSWALLAVALAAQILVVLDISVVNTALPDHRQLAAPRGRPDLQWLVTAYLMMSGGGLLLGGRISDLLSRRGVFLTGLALFTVASLVSGFADSGSQLIAARAVQGLSAALLTPSALSLITTTYAGAQRKTALALWGAVGSLGVAAGVLLGGAITTWASWQYIFWINVPIGLVALLVGHRVIAKDDRDPPQPASTSTSPAPSPSSAGSPPSSTASRRHRDPRLVVGPDRDRARARPRSCWSRSSSSSSAPPSRCSRRTSGSSSALVSGTAVMLGVTGILVGAVFLTSIFLQTVLGYSALRDRARVPAVRARHHRRHRGRPAPAGPPLSARHRGHRAASSPSPPRCALHRRRRRALRLRPAPGPVRAGSRRRHGVRARSR